MNLSPVSASKPIKQHRIFQEMKGHFMTALALALFMGGVSHAEDITIRYNGEKATVKKNVKDSISVTVEGAHVSVVSTYQAHRPAERKE